MLAGVFALAACGPMPVAQAEEICEERARRAAGPTGSATFGYNTDTGPINDVEIVLSSDYLTGRNPQSVFAQCVRQRSGQSPTRPPRL